jgi:hypothetical protein
MMSKVQKVKGGKVRTFVKSDEIRTDVVEQGFSMSLALQGKQ